MTDSNKKISRRDLIKSASALAAILTSTESAILQSILAGMSNVAHAEDLIDNDNILFLIGNAGGMPKWLYDMPIIPNGNDIVVPNGMVKNKLILENGVLSAEYALHEFESYFLPYLWASEIPTSSGGKVPMTNIIRQALMIRGYDLINDGHDQNFVKHNAPVAGGYSLSGILADATRSIFPAMHTINRMDHKSLSGKNSQQFAARTDKKTMSETFRAFKIASDSRILKFADKGEVVSQDKKKKALSQFFREALSEIGSSHEDKEKRKIIHQAQESAMTMLSKDWSNLDSIYQANLAKYESLIFNSVSNIVLPGIDDIPILAPIHDSLIDAKKELYNNAKSKTEQDKIQKEINQLRTEMKRYATRGADIINFPKDSNVDIKSLLQNSSNISIFGLAHSFAVAEYLVTNRLTNNALITSGGYLNANKTNFDSFDPDMTTRSKIETDNSISNDSHYTGVYPSVYLYSVYYRSVASCINEMIEVLKTTPNGKGNLFDNTTMLQFTEFNRSAKFDGTGSDHGYGACSATVISGKLDQFSIIGNIQSNSGGNYKGTWGSAAKTEATGNRVMNIGNVASTIAALCDMKSPTPNDTPLVKKVGAKFKPLTKDRPKNVS